MGLEVLAGPGCDDVGKNAYIEGRLGPDDVVISVGRIFKALTVSEAIQAPTRLRCGWQSICKVRRSEPLESGSYQGLF